ncbi:MAG: hypothetical protein JSU83_20135 [Deltaproteobacteria bacterium]|nr:MAG: hypothetical protein JSU83_20135 [Deltaproteobacteria bacterium]
MKQKYLIMKDTDKKVLIIREFAELDKEVLSPLCEETYDDKVIKSAMKNGKEALIAALRTKNMYPPGIYANQIADSVIKIYTSKQQSIELFFDDVELINKEEEASEVLAELDSETEEIDLLQNDYDENFEDKGALKNINSPLKVADDEFVDIDDES